MRFFTSGSACPVSFSFTLTSPVESPTSIGCFYFEFDQIRRGAFIKWCLAASASDSRPNAVFPLFPPQPMPSQADHKTPLFSLRSLDYRYLNVLLSFSGTDRYVLTGHRTVDIPLSSYQNRASVNLLPAQSESGGRLLYRLSAA